VGTCRLQASYGALKDDAAPKLGQVC
jgi:hypothetical protein